MNNLGIKKGDLIEVIAGDEKGRQGRIMAVITKRNRLIVEGINICKKHQKPYGTRPAGIIDKPMPIHRSNVMLICPKCVQKTKVRWRREGERRVRYCKKCGENID